MKRVLCVVLLVASCSKGASMESACNAYNDWLDEEAEGLRTGEESRDDLKNEVHSKAAGVDELEDESDALLHAYTTYVQTGSTGEIGDAMRAFSDVCDANGYTP